MSLGMIKGRWRFVWKFLEIAEGGLRDSENF
jgi:hypothetical protein